MCSMISKQVNELRIAEETCRQMGKEVIAKFLSEAADTIETLSTKLQAVENMERSYGYYGGGWIMAEDRIPITSEYMELEPTPYMKRLEIAYMTDTVEYLIGFYDGCKWIDKHHNIIKNVIAWKPFFGLSEFFRP